jgi:DNA-directed RNA polymerase subunit RPC12/RpoP
MGFREAAQMAGLAVVYSCAGCGEPFGPDEVVPVEKPVEGHSWKRTDYRCLPCAKVAEKKGAKVKWK